MRAFSPRPTFLRGLTALLLDLLLFPFHSCKHAHPPPPTPPTCKRVLWFTSLSLPHHEALNTTDYTDYLQVALLSALRNAPSLVPVLVYDGPACPLTGMRRVQQKGCL